MSIMQLQLLQLYGSISAVTFITGITYLQSLGVEYGGYMVACHDTYGINWYYHSFSICCNFSKKDSTKDNAKMSQVIPLGKKY